MSLPLQSWIAMMLFNLLVLIFFCTKTLKRYVDKSIKSNDIKFILTLLCVIIAISSMIYPRPTPMPIVILGVIAFIFTLTLAYSIAYSDLNRVEHHISQDKFTPIIILFCIIISILGYLNGNNLVYFIENEPYKPTIIYYAYQYISYGFMLWLEMKMTKLYFENILKYKNTSVCIRNILILIGWFISVLCFGAVIINLTFSLNNIETHTLNNFFHSVKGFAALFITLGEISQKSYNKLIDNAAAKIDNVVERINEEIRELHRTAVKITPIVQLPDKSVKEVRIMAEIGHSFRVICTNIQHPKRVSSRLMAKYIFDNKDKILSYGPYPPIQKIIFPKLYYLLVCRHLRKLNSTSKKGSSLKWFIK